MLHRHVWLGGSVAVGVLLLTAGTPTQALASLTTSLAGAGAGDPFAPVVAAVALMAWLVLGYVVIVSGVLLLARLPGTAGAVFHVLERLLAPAVLRRSLELALGLSVVVGTVGLSTAAANASTDSPGAQRTQVTQQAGLPDLDWPLTPDIADAPSSLTSPAAPVPPPRPTSDTGDSTTADGPTSDGPTSPSARAVDTVVVQPGDTLWDLAAQSLRASGQTRPAAATIAQAWPQWWSANRAVIGADPDLLLPGTTLTPPG